jgi:NAD(P)-dependent dehydrogenase (short-subunit alcohol dehydrogenase family)
MDLELAGKIAVVTGASKGIGLAITKTLVAEGALVVAGARRVDSLSGLDGVSAVAVDLSTPEGPGTLIEAALAQHGQVDVLVNNVGAAPIRLEGFMGTTDADWAATFELNLFAALRAIRASLTHMLPRGEGVIVNVASVNAFFQPDSAVIDYGAAKAGLVNASKALAQELGPKGLRINCVSPGQVATDLWLGDHGVAATVGAATGAGAAEIAEQAAAAIPTGRFTTPEEVATLVVMLASPRTANVNGSEFVVDGGLIATT